MKESFAQLIRRIHDLPPELIEQLYGLCERRRMAKGAFFVRAGECPTLAGINLAGIFRLTYTDADGRESTKGFSIPGNFVIAYSAMVEKRPSFFSIECLTDCEILQFDYFAWRELVDADMRWYPFTFKLLEAVYLKKERRERSFLLDDARTRYEGFRREFPGLEEQIPLYQIASYIGVTPETLSRVRRAVSS